jgi:hypothetical protein
MSDALLVLLGAVAALLVSGLMTMPQTACHFQ